MIAKQTKIRRAGRTSRTWRFETNYCQFDSNSITKTLDLRFEIKSKGGGFTEIQVKIGQPDFPEIRKLIERVEQ